MWGLLKAVGSLLTFLGLFLAGLVLVWKYGLDKKEGNTVVSVIRLLQQGSIRWQGWGWKPLSLQGLALVQPDRIGGHTILEIARVETKAPASALLTGKQTDVHVEGARLDCTSDPEGLLYLVALLQDVKFWREVHSNTVPEQVAPPKHISRESGGELDAMSQLPTGEVAVQADLQILFLRFLAEPAVVLLPLDVKMMLGENVRVKAVLGQKNLLRCTDERIIGRDSSWIQNPPSADSPSGKGSYPVAALVESSGLRLTARAWRTKRGFYFPHRIKAILGFTPDLAKFGFARLHPMLQHAVSMDERQDVECTIAPLQMHLPADCLTLRLAPMRLRVATKSLISLIVKLLTITGSSDDLKVNELQAWTGEMEAVYHRTGMVESKRMDMLLGRRVHTGQGGIHVCMWGKVDTGHNNAVDMTLGLPSRALRRMGIKHVEESRMLTFHVGGTAHNPDIDIVQAGKDIMALYMEESSLKHIPLLSGLSRRIRQRRESRTEGMTMVEEPAIPPAHPLPWDPEVAVDEPGEWDAARAHGSAAPGAGSAQQGTSSAQPGEVVAQQGQDEAQPPAAPGKPPKSLADCPAATSKWIADPEGRYDDPSFIAG